MTATLQISLPQATLLDAASQLESDELDSFLDALLKIRARRIAPSISASEVALIEQIHAAELSADEKTRLQELSLQLELEEINDDEHVELLALADKSESLNVKRMQAVSKLAIKRGQTLDNVLHEIGLLNRHG